MVIHEETFGSNHKIIVLIKNCMDFRCLSLLRALLLPCFCVRKHGPDLTESSFYSFNNLCPLALLKCKFAHKTFSWDTPKIQVDSEFSLQHVKQTSLS